MKFQKIALALATTAFLIAANHSALAAVQTTVIQTTVTRTSGTKTPTATQKSNTAKNSVGKSNKRAASKKTRVKSQNKAVSQNKVAAKKSKAIAKRKRMSVDEEIAREARGFDIAAVANPVRSESVMADIQKTNRTAVKVKALKPEENIFSGNVNFTTGKDSNIDPDRTNIEGTYFQINPSLNFTSGGWSGSFGASIKDFADQNQSDLYKQNEATASTSFTAKISDITTSTTTLSGLYHDEKWPDYVNTTAGYDAEGRTQSMPIRYSEISLAQKLGFNFGAVNTEIGGSLKHRDSYSLFPDFAPKVFGLYLYEKDFNEIKAFGALTLSAASFLDLSVKPSVAQLKYDKGTREGRFGDGTTPGLEYANPVYELITSEVAVDANFKFLGSSITPTALIGQVSDQAAGAEDQSYYGFGISSSLVLHEGTKLTLTPNFSYKKMTYDNWTKGIVPVGEKRIEDETSTGVNASIQLAKNFGIGAAYSLVTENSNIVADTSENYRQEIISSSLTFNF